MCEPTSKNDVELARGFIYVFSAGRCVCVCVKIGQIDRVVD